MANISIKIVISNLAEVMAVFDRIKIYRSTTGCDGPFVEITTPATRLVLVEGQTIYQFIDTTGDDAYFYTNSYFHATTLLESSQSEPSKGSVDFATSILTIDELKTNYLFGVNLTDDSGTPYPDSLFTHYIRSAVSWMEQSLDIKILPTAICDEHQDYYQQDWIQWGKLKTDFVPVIAVDKVDLFLSGSKVISFDPTWIEVDHNSGQINIVPAAGDVSQLLFLGSGISSIIPPQYRYRTVPGAFRIDYTAGFRKNKIPPVLKNAIGLYSSIGPLNIAGDLIAGAGIANQSIGVDGLSQSIGTTSSATNSGYGARILEYKNELKILIPQLRRSFHPIGFVGA